MSYAELIKRENIFERHLHEIDQEMFETEEPAVLEELRIEKASVELELSKIRLALYMKNTV